MLRVDAVRDLFHMSGIHKTTTAATPSGLLLQFLSSSSAGKAKHFNSRERKHFVFLKFGKKKSENGNCFLFVCLYWNN